LVIPRQSRGITKRNLAVLRNTLMQHRFFLHLPFLSFSCRITVCVTRADNQSMKNQTALFSDGQEAFVIAPAIKHINQAA
jgi:hypothetical protein